MGRSVCSPYHIELCTNLPLNWGHLFTRTANWVSVVSFIERFHCTQTDYPLPLPIVLKAAIVISGKHTDGCSLYTCKRHNTIHGHTYLLHLFVYYWFPTVAPRHALRWHLIWCSCNRRSECGKKLLYSEWDVKLLFWDWWLSVRCRKGVGSLLTLIQAENLTSGLRRAPHWVGSA